MLIVKLVLFVLVFALTAALVSMQTYPTDGIPLAKNFDETNIDVMLENGATLDWEIVDGEIVFDITQSGDNYDDITVFMFFREFSYDSSFMRSLLGENAGNHEEYISEMENGPWLAHCNFCLKGESYFTTTKGQYTFGDNTLTEYVENVVSSEANTVTQTESFNVNKEDSSVMVALTFGAENSGALENGKYTLHTELKLGHPEGKKLNIGYFDVVKTLFKLAGQSIERAGMEIFSVTNWLTFYCIWVILGWFIYLWRDMRAVFKVFFAVLCGDYSGAGIVIVSVYRNGTLVSTYEDTSDSGSQILVAILCAALAWVALTITIPIRMLWYMIRDIFYLFKEDEVLEDFSYMGNLLGSVGIHVIIVGIAGVFGIARMFGAIALVVGIAMCIGAHYLCKAVEY